MVEILFASEPSCHAVHRCIQGSRLVTLCNPSLFVVVRNVEGLSP